jgi:uncharacterized protein involved in exopolysaccharide biosynthesis
LNTPQVPSVEWIQGPPPAGSDGGRRWRRWKVFVGVLLVAALAGVAIVYSRAPLYRASASVLTVKPKAVDMRSEEADQEHVAIQRRLLLGDALLKRVTDALAADDPGQAVDPDVLRNVLSAHPVPDTNLLELRAEGGDPAWLQGVVNQWAGAYETFRAEQIAEVAGRTTAELEEEQARLQQRITASRAELQAFRESHDIVSLERAENSTLARLNGLNAALNKARERVVEARAARAAVQEAVAKGETVIPAEQKADIARQQLDVQRMRDRLAKLNERYTQKYLDRDPVLKALPEQLREAERDLERALALARRTVLDEAAQAVDAAERSVVELEAELAEHQQRVQQFTASFKEFKALEEGLARLEALYADNAERLAQIQVQNREKYPPVQVVDWAILPTRPVYPDYQRDLFIALGVAFALALFVTWLLEYLGERPRTVPYMGLRVYGHGGAATGALDAPTDGRAALPGAAPGPGLPRAAAPPGPAPRELRHPEVQALLEAADEVLAGYVALLLSGVAPQELALLQAHCLDASTRVLSVPGTRPRDLQLGEAAAVQLAGLLRVQPGPTLSVNLSQLEGALAGTAARAGIAEPQQVTLPALRYTYALYLVRQGLALDELSGQLGELDPGLAAWLADYAPPAAERTLGQVQTVFPGL